MVATWDEASRCPRDGFTGKVMHRKSVPGNGQMVTLVCPGDNCEYHATGWVVQIRPDNTIPDVIPPEQRTKQFAPTPMSLARRRMVMDALEEQVANEQRAGTEVRGNF